MIFIQKLNIFSKKSLLEQSWAQAKNSILASKPLKICKCKILQPSHPYCRSLKWVKIGSLNIISNFLVWTPSLAIWEYITGHTIWLLVSIVTLVLCIRLFFVRSNYCSSATRFETSCAFSCTFNFRYSKGHAKKWCFTDMAISCMSTVKNGLDCHLVFQLLARIRYLSAPLVHNQKRYYLGGKKIFQTFSVSVCDCKKQAKEHFKL